MSASRIPTWAPSFASPTARFTAIVLLPTPPFPAPTRMMFFTPGVSCDCATPGAERTWAPQATSTRRKPAASRAPFTSLPMVSLSGQAGVVSSTFSRTVSPSTERSLTIPRETRSRRSSGSSTLRRASSAAALSSGMRRLYSGAAGASQRRRAHLLERVHAPTARLRDEQRGPAAADREPGALPVSLDGPLRRDLRRDACRGLACGGAGAAEVDGEPRGRVGRPPARGEERVGLVEPSGVESAREAAEHLAGCRVVGARGRRRERPRATGAAARDRAGKEEGRSAVHDGSLYTNAFRGATR